MKQLEWKGNCEPNLGGKSFLESRITGLSKKIFGNHFLMQILVKGKGSPFNKSEIDSAAESRLGSKES